MDWVEKYNVGCYNLNGIKWIIKFFEDGYSGDVTTFKGSGSQFKYQLQNDSDDIFAPLKPTQVSVSAQIETLFGITDLYSTEDMQFWVELYEDEESDACLYWCGWVDPKQYKESYDVAPYEVEIVCVDGLSLLSTILYAEQDSEDATEYYNGRRKESEIILDILGKIGHTEFKEYINK